MRLVSVDAGGHPRAALLRDRRVFDIWGGPLADLPAEDRTLEAILEAGLLGEVMPVDGDAGVPLDEVRLLPPVTRAQLPRTREGAGRRAARNAHLLRQVPQRAGGTGRHGSAAALE